MGREGLIDLVHAAHDRSPFGGGQRRGRPHTGRGVALHGVERDSQLVFKGVDGVEVHAEDTDRTRKGQFVGHDDVGGTRNVITSAGGIGAHRNDHRFLGFQQLHFAPDDVRSQCTAAGGVHAQHHGLDLLVVAHAGQRRSQRIAVNLLSEAFAVDDRAVGIDDGHLIGRDVFEVGAYLRSVFAQRDEIILSVGIGRYAQFGEYVLHLVLVDQAVHEAVFEGILRQRNLQFVGDAVQLLQVDAAGFGDRAGDGVPHRIHERLHLLAVGVRHFGKDIRLDGALVFAGRRAEHFGLDLEFVEQALVEHQVERETRPVHGAFGLHVDLVGRRSEVIFPLRIGLVVSDDEFAALLEIDDRFTQLFQQGRAHHAAVAVHPQVNALDAAVVLGGFERAQSLHQRKLARGAQRGEVDPGEGIARRSVGQHIRKVDLEDRLRMHGHRLLHRASYAQQNEYPEKKYQKRPHDEGEDRSQKSLDKIHNVSFIVCPVSFRVRIYFANIRKFYEKQIKFIVFR